MNKRKLRALLESMATPRPIRQRGNGATPPPTLAPVSGGTAAIRVDHGGNNAAPPATPVAAPKPAKLARTAVKRWDGKSRRPQQGGALRRPVQEGLQPFQPLLEYNPYHDAQGRFATKGGAKATVAYAGKRPVGGVKAAMERRGEGSQRLAQHDRDWINRSPRSAWHEKADGMLGSARKAHQRGDVARRDRAKTLAGTAGANARRLLSPHQDSLGARERVPQDPGKHTRAMSDGQLPEGAVRTTAATRGSRLEQDNAARIKQGRAGDVSAAQHGLASKVYRDARLAKQDGMPELSAKLRKGGDQYRAAAKTQPKRTGRPEGVDLSPGTDQLRGAARMREIAARMKAEGKHADAAWTLAAASKIEQKAAQKGRPTRGAAKVTREVRDLQRLAAAELAAYTKKARQNEKAMGKGHRGATDAAIATERRQINQRLKRMGVPALPSGKGKG